MQLGKKWLGVVLTVVCAVTLTAAEGVPIVNAAGPKTWRITNGRGAVSADGKVIKMQQPGIAASTLGVYPIDGGSDVTKVYQGISFRVRGNGSDEWGCLNINNGSRCGGVVYFPVKNTDWVEYNVAFADMAPSGDHTCGLPRNVPVGDFGYLGFGDYWRIKTGNLPRETFEYEVADLKLLPSVPSRFEKIQYRPMPLEKAIAKMKKGEKVSILCFGDSITAGTGLKDRARESYPVLVGPELAKIFNNPNITSAGAATGGAHTYQSIGWLDRDLEQGGMPDIATMLIGYNNCSAAQSAEVYRAQLEMWIQRLTRLTRGQCAIVLIPTVPGVPRFSTQDYMAEVTREVARKYGCAIAPLDKAVKAIGPKDYRSKYLVDSVHPNAAGHQIFARELTAVLSGQQK